MAISLVIRGGTVYDGSGGAGRRADIAVDGDRLALVGEVTADSGVPQLDATGLAVAPGFINVLSHAWGTLQTEHRAPSDLLQGVTTEVFGEGISLGPGCPDLLALLETSPVREGQRAAFDRLSEGLDYLERGGVAPNVASFVGAENLRVLGAGLSDRPVDPQALDRVRGVLAEEMADGALGLGSALIYPPGRFASTGELVALSEIVAQHDGLYISHMRSEGDQFLEALDELTGIARKTGVRAEVYHLKAFGRANWPKMAAAIGQIEAARAEGLAISADMYPYTAGNTALGSSIPPWHHVGGPAALAARLADKGERARMAREIAAPSDDFENLYLGSGGGSGILLAGGREPDERLDGRRLSAIAAEQGKDEIEALLDIVLDDPSMSAIYFMIDEDNLQLGLRQPWVSIGSDSESPAAEPPWTAQPTHPRAYGAFSRFLGRYCRDLRLVPLAEAVRRMTSQPADTLRLAGRGRLTAGSFADVVVFDPAVITDHATYEQPHQYATGVRHVIVNGQPVVQDGAFTGALPGRRLRRGQ